MQAETGSKLANGVVIQPRKFEFRELESIPQYWFANNPLLTHFNNAFSLMIPPGEIFFIRSVRNYEQATRDPELKQAIRAFAAQEGYHTKAHHEFNASFAKFGVDVAWAERFSQQAIDRLERRLPKKLRLGATVFLEHLTATGAHMLLSEPKLAEQMHPEALRFWRWHAAEELEHKAVAFDLFREVGGGYFLRILSAVATLALLGGSFIRLARAMIRRDPTRITAAHHAQARELNRHMMRKQVKLFFAFFRPGFHPWKIDDQKYLAAWYAAPETAAL